MPVDLTKAAILATVALAVTICAYIHARRHHEGLPPSFDAFFSGISFISMCGAFIIGGRLAEPYGLVTEGRIAGLALSVAVLRWLRARLGIELAEWAARK